MESDFLEEAIFLGGAVFRGQFSRGKFSGGHFSEGAFFPGKFLLEPFLFMLGDCKDFCTITISVHDKNICKLSAKALQDSKSSCQKQVFKTHLTCI